MFGSELYAISSENNIENASLEVKLGCLELSWIFGELPSAIESATEHNI